MKKVLFVLTLLAIVTSPAWVAAAGKTILNPAGNDVLIQGSGDLAVSGNLDIDGTSTMDGVTVDSGGLTITSGGS